MRALVVDDDDAFRTLVVALLAEVADVVEQAADGDVAVQLARDLRPDLIVMDITMPRIGVSGSMGEGARMGYWLRKPLEPPSHACFSGS
jgi:CheY-like chemotaxis protein